MTDQSFGPQARKRVLARILARHTRAIEDGRWFSSGFHLVYLDDDGRPLLRDMPLKMTEWLSSARGDIDRQLEELAAALASEQAVEKLAATIVPGFVGAILIINAGYRQENSRHLISERQEMLVASLATLDGEVVSARRLLDDKATEFCDGEEQDVPWDLAIFKQLLFTLDDALRMHAQQADVCTVAGPVVLVIQAATVRVGLPVRAQQAPETPKLNL